MRRFIPIIILTIGASTLLQSRSFPALGEGDDAEKVSAVASAKAKYDAAFKVAGETYQKLLLDADQTYIDTLTKAEDAAMKLGIAGKPDTDAIDAARLAAIETMKQHRGGATDRPNAHDIADKTFWYGNNNSGGNGLRKMLFESDGSISIGADRYEQSWAVSDGKLVIFDRN